VLKGGVSFFWFIFFFFFEIVDKHNLKDPKSKTFFCLILVLAFFFVLDFWGLSLVAFSKKKKKKIFHK